MRPRMGYSATHRSVRRSEYFTKVDAATELDERSFWMRPGDRLSPGDLDVSAD